MGNKEKFKSSLISCWERRIGNTEIKWFCYPILIELELLQLN
jgi:hypothetical protein